MKEKRDVPVQIYLTGTENKVAEMRSQESGLSKSDVLRSALYYKPDEQKDCLFAKLNRCHTLVMRAIKTETQYDTPHQKTLNILNDLNDILNSKI